MNHPLKTLHAEIRKHLKCFPNDKELHNLKLYSPEELCDAPFIEVELQREKNMHWEHYRVNFIVTSVQKIKKN